MVLEDLPRDGPPVLRPDPSSVGRPTGCPVGRPVGAADPLHPVWTLDRTPAGVLRAMTAEGLLVELLPRVWVAADLARDAGARAAALGALLQRVARCEDVGGEDGGTAVAQRAVVGLAAAAWLHGCPQAPARVDLLVPCGTGSRDLPAPLRLRRVADPAARAVRLGPLRASDRGRTLDDLRRLGRGRRDADALRWLEGSARPGPSGAGVPPHAWAGLSGAESARRPVER